MLMQRMCIGLFELSHEAQFVRHTEGMYRIDSTQDGRKKIMGHPHYHRVNPQVVQKEIPYEPESIAQSFLQKT